MDDLFTCPFSDCSATFSKEKRLKIHLYYHKNERPHICTHDDCTASFKRPDHLRRHEKTHETNYYSCAFDGCDKKFKSTHTLKKHLKNFHGDKKIFKCSFCKKEFPKHQHLKVHEFQHTNIKNYKCTFEGCGKSFIIPSHLKKHLKCHKGYKCEHENCTETFNKWTLYRSHKKLFHPPEYPCSICQKIFRKKFNLKQHLECHEKNQTSFSCTHENCCREYLLERSLKQHIRCCHQEPQFHCIVEGCDKKYKHKNNLKKHTREHSPNYKPKPKMNNEKKKYKFHKHKSVASTLSNYTPSKEEERAILNRDKLFVESKLKETANEIGLSNENNNVMNNENVEFKKILCVIEGIPNPISSKVEEIMCES